MNGLRATAATVALVCLALPLAFSASAEEDATEPHWTGSISAGVAITASATDTYGGNLQANATRDWDKHRLSFEGKGTVSATKEKNDNNETKVTKTANAQSLFGEYRYKFTPRLFGYNDQRFFRDTIQRIRFAYLTSAGPGYRFWEGGEKRYFDAKTGMGYLHQEFLRSDLDDESKPIRRDDTRDLLTWSASFEHANVVFDSIEIKHTGGVIVPVADANQFIATTELSASLPIVMGWAFRNTVGFRWENDPASEADEATINYTAGLEYKF